MLVLTRKIGQRIILGNDVEITVIQIRGNRVRLGVAAPRDLTVTRSEVLARPGMPSERTGLS